MSINLMMRYLSKQSKKVTPHQSNQQNSQRGIFHLGVHLKVRVISSHPTVIPLFIVATIFWCSHGPTMLSFLDVHMKEKRKKIQISNEI
jgi:hypothetical protein